MYFIPPYEQFISEYKQDVSLMLILYGINVCYYFYILWCHISKVTTGEVTATTLKVISATTKVTSATEEVITATIKSI